MKYKKLLEYSIIEKASQGDNDCIKLILDFYKPYIKTLATVECASNSGKIYWVVDEEAQDRMNIRLITRVLKFNPIPQKKDNIYGKGK